MCISLKEKTRKPQKMAQQSDISRVAQYLICDRPWRPSETADFVGWPMNVVALAFSGDCTFC